MNDALPWVAAQVHLHGGRADARLAAGTTHVVLVPGVTGRWEPSAGELLEALQRGQGGAPALSTLRRGLLAGRVHVVRSRCAPMAVGSAKSGSQHHLLASLAMLEWGCGVLAWPAESGSQQLLCWRPGHADGGFACSWVEACLAALHEAQPGGHAERPSEEQHAALPGSAGGDTTAR